MPIKTWVPKWTLAPIFYFFLGSVMSPEKKGNRWNPSRGARSKVGEEPRCDARSYGYANPPDSQSPFIQNDAVANLLAFSRVPQRR